MVAKRSLTTRPLPFLTLSTAVFMLSTRTSFDMAIPLSRPRSLAIKAKPCCADAPAAGEQRTAAELEGCGRRVYKRTLVRPVSAAVPDARRALRTPFVDRGSGAAWHLHTQQHERAHLSAGPTSLL